MPDTALATHTDAGYERALLGALLTGQARPDGCGVIPEQLWEPKHALLLVALLDAQAAGVPGEPVAVAGWLAQQGRLKEVGGAPYLAELVGTAANGQSASWYGEQLAEMARKRAIINGAARIRQAGENPAMSSEQLAAMATDLGRAAAPRADRMLALADIAETGLREIELRGDAPAGLYTGFPDVDAMMPGGWHRGNLVTVAAPTGGGKTTFALNVLTNMVRRQGAAGAMFSMEMTCQEVFDKLLAEQTGIPLSILRTGKLDDQDWSAAARAVGEMAQWPMAVQDGSATVEDIRRACRVLRERWGRLDVIVVDYVQLVKAGRGGYSREGDVAEVVRELRRLALDEDVLVIMAVQCNRNALGRQDKTPILSDMRESGEIENSSVVVIMLYSPGYYEPESPRAGETDVYVMKNRFGPSGCCATLAAQLHRSRFASLAPTP